MNKMKLANREACADFFAHFLCSNHAANASRNPAIRTGMPTVEASYEGIGTRSVNGCWQADLGFHVACPAMY